MSDGRNKRSSKYGFWPTKAYSTRKTSLTNGYFSMLQELILNVSTAATTMTLTATMDVLDGMVIPRMDTFMKSTVIEGYL
ncbi:hypothetical protein Y032_0212g2236 [Ancylostoma ceylanicum]|uniref:Uncharacterized protein n=1 Tax=Ancylostoma ceylanicum TaxID=53326 RepID=A0A016SKP4_9BILA|nr:hypothetical protein Y032_0212g2236 [Ancylostoma ceylanicum]